MSTETNYDPDCLLIPITENTEILKNKAIKVENDEKKYLITTIEEVIDEGIENMKKYYEMAKEKRRIKALNSLDKRLAEMKLLLKAKNINK